MASVPQTMVEYEFTADQNAQFKAAAFWMGIMGRLGILFGALSCLLILVADVTGLIGGIVGIVAGVFTLRAASASGRVAGTTGRDIENVMVAVVNLKSLYRLQAILIGIAFGLIVLALAVGAGARVADRVPNLESRS